MSLPKLVNLCFLLLTIILSVIQKVHSSEVSRIYTPEEFDRLVGQAKSQSNKVVYVVPFILDIAQNKIKDAKQSGAEGSPSLNNEKSTVEKISSTTSTTTQLSIDSRNLLQGGCIEGYVKIRGRCRQRFRFHA